MKSLKSRCGNLNRLLRIPMTSVDLRSNCRVLALGVLRQRLQGPRDTRAGPGTLGGGSAVSVLDERERVG